MRGLSQPAPEAPSDFRWPDIESPEAVAIWSADPFIGIEGGAGGAGLANGYAVTSGLLLLHGHLFWASDKKTQRTGRDLNQAFARSMLAVLGRNSFLRKARARRLLSFLSAY